MPRVLNKKDHPELEARIHSIRNDLANAVCWPSFGWAVKEL